MNLSASGTVAQRLHAHSQEIDKSLGSVAKHDATDVLGKTLIPIWPRIVVGSNVRGDADFGASPAGVEFFGAFNETEFDTPTPGRIDRGAAWAARTQPRSVLLRLIAAVTVAAVTSRQLRRSRPLA
jgi:hypothetical protein